MAGRGGTAGWCRQSNKGLHGAAEPVALSGYDASEAKSVHRESLWDPKRERAGLAISPRCQSPLAAPLPPPSQLPQAHANLGTRGRGESHDAL